jgi:S-adenosylmethionine:tRNA ribosyltransferase-isomerase
VYARVEGAVAAPTAGLHFSQDLLASLAAAGTERTSVTLHVGPGTFRPITADDPRAHDMERSGSRSPRRRPRACERPARAGGRIVAVGTTSVRALESMADLHAG